MKKGNKNYLIQSNFFTESVMRNISEIQKDILYFIQQEINYYDDNPPEYFIFSYDKFLEVKGVKRNDFYTPTEIFEFCNQLITAGGVFYNKREKSVNFFNILGGVKVLEENTNEFQIEFTNWGKRFFYEKYAREYAQSVNIPHTQIEKNIIYLNGDRRKKFFELLSQYKATGLYRVKLEHLKSLLGFIEYVPKNNMGDTIGAFPIQLKLLFEEDDSEMKNYEKVEYLKVWYDFRKNFLDPAIEAFNNNPKLDISNIQYSTMKTGRKITGLEFRFQKRMVEEELNNEQKVALQSFMDYGLTKAQILFLFQRIGYRLMWERFNSAVTFNNRYDDNESPLYRKKIWFSNETKEEIRDLSGFLYKKVFPELH